MKKTTKKSSSRKDYSQVDVIRLLEHLGVEYRLDGKNISRGWVGIETCPICGAGGFHCGINIHSKTFNCWVGGCSGMIPKFVKELLDCNWAMANEIVNKFRDRDTSRISTQSFIFEPQVPSVVFPLNLDSKLNKVARRFLLKRRGYYPDVLENNYGIMSVGSDGVLSHRLLGKDIVFRNRIIIPIIYNGEVVNYVGMDYTENQDEKYKNCPNALALVPTKSCLYNIDSVRDRALIVEGAADAWRMGSETIATLGKTVTKEQLLTLCQKKLKTAIVLFDSDAQGYAVELAYQLRVFIPKVRVVLLDDGDPDDLEDDEALRMKIELFGAMA